MHKNRVRIRALGRLETLPDDLRKAIDRASEATKDYDQFNLNVAVAYGGRTELVDATVEIAQQVKNGLLLPKDVTEDHTNNGFVTNPNICSSHDTRN